VAIKVQCKEIKGTIEMAAPFLPHSTSTITASLYTICSNIGPQANIKKYNWIWHGVLQRFKAIGPCTGSGTWGGFHKAVYALHLKFALCAHLFP
jgi:hypothetical protein